MKYLVKIKFDCNDADYAYGLLVIDDEDLKNLKDKNRKITLGNSDRGGAERKIKDCLDIEEISDSDVDVLKRLGLLKFGEGEMLADVEELNFAFEKEEE
jgi:hypothetical protein